MEIIWIFFKWSLIYYPENTFMVFWNYSLVFLLDKISRSTTGIHNAPKINNLSQFICIFIKAQHMLSSSSVLMNNQQETWSFRISLIRTQCDNMDRWFVIKERKKGMLSKSRSIHEIQVTFVKTEKNPLLFLYRIIAYMYLCNV